MNLSFLRTTLRCAVFTSTILELTGTSHAGTTVAPIASPLPSAQTPPSAAEEFGDEPSVKSSDPLETLNRGIFAFNHQFYRFLLRPLAKVTETLVPKVILDHIGNVFDNIETPIRVGSSLLQGNLTRASKETGKLLLNSTVGLAGIFRPSDKLPCLSDVPAEDVGQAFGKWGIPQGPYLVLPIWGPSSCRDFPGKLGDAALNPTAWIGTPALRYSLSGTRAVQQNPSRLKVYDLAREGALDEYIAVRESYLSYRAEAVRK